MCRLKLMSTLGGLRLKVLRTKRLLRVARSTAILLPALFWSCKATLISYRTRITSLDIVYHSQCIWPALHHEYLMRASALACKQSNVY